MGSDTRQPTIQEIDAARDKLALGCVFAAVGIVATIVSGVSSILNSGEEEKLICKQRFFAETQSLDLFDEFNAGKLKVVDEKTCSWKFDRGNGKFTFFEYPVHEDSETVKGEKNVWSLDPK